ncbi:acyltransferase family protein [Vibrio sp. HN007]|uniref:acyltransferase family protein n=1 Tax=Vibrio iocasae TaxID=3098914 RepID=UPI0035D4021B
MNFRYDINGLRAIAVIAVVLFHFNPVWIPGGFAGVDVFFVISGFLMTGIIFRGLESADFNLLKFYRARAKRIIPALFAVSVVLLVYGWFFLNPLDYKPLGRHIASSLVFLSNVVYWSESGYFAASAEDNWLLHTWSLSVEWQFYIIYPIVLLILNKVFSIENIKRLLVVATGVAFLFSWFATMKWADPSYFLLPTRAWEMMAGGLAYLYPWNLKGKQQSAVGWLGLLLIGLSYALISSDVYWPGYLAMVPVSGAYFILVANQQDGVIAKSNILQRVGKWSYSIYLWHWPIVAFGSSHQIENWYVPGLILSVALGWFSYNFIEQVGTKWAISKLHMLNMNSAWNIATFSAVALSAFCVYHFDGVLDRYSEPEKTSYVQAIAAQGDWGYPNGNMNINGLEVRYIDGKSDKNLLLIGASHIEHLYPYVANHAEDYNIYFLTQGGCFATESMRKPTSGCENLKGYKDLLSEVNFDRIVTSFFCFHCSLDETEKEIDNRIAEYDVFLRDLKAETEDLYLITGEPRGEAFDPKLALEQGLDDYVTEAEVRASYKIHNYALSNLTELGGIKMVDPIEHLCENGICKTRAEDGKFYYKDTGHLRPWYVKKKLSYMDDIFES